MLHLASRSPRRAELLARLGLEFGLLDLDVPEQRGEGEPAADYVRRVAREKAGAGLLEVVAVPGAASGQVSVLGSDTEVILGDRVFGKPADAGEAAEMLRALSGRTHEVLTAVSLVSAGREAQAAVLTRVTVEALSDDAIARYLACGEWQGKAGAYAIQGRFEAHVQRLDGSYSGVMGLPLHETAGLLRQFGLLP
jgi:septum formation protein